MYSYKQATLTEIKFISGLSDLLTEDHVDLFHEADDEVSRISFDGIVTLVGFIENQKIGVILTDFRVGGGSFSKKNSRRVSQFIKELDQSKIPLVFIMNSLGVRFMEGRTVFDDAFQIIADLCQFRKNNPLITISLGKTLGISALFFSQGHYRMALEDETQLNLTGPEVHKKFFGNANEVFSQFTMAEHQFEVNSLIHEILPCQISIYKTVRDLVSFLFVKNSKVTRLASRNFNSELEQGGLCIRTMSDEKLKELESQLGGSIIELFPQRSPIVRIYAGKIHGQVIGYFVNPPGHPNNMLTANAIDKCIAALELFKALKIPVISILDCPGGDPRKAESDKDGIMKMIKLTHDMIDYPYPKMGIIMGRCFGGSAMFTFPKIYGGQKNLAVRGAQMGIMHRDIIEELLSGAPRLKAAWTEVADTEVPTLEDLLKCGTIDKVIEKSEIHSEIILFLTQNEIKISDHSFPKKPRFRFYDAVGK